MRQWTFFYQSIKKIFENINYGSSYKEKKNCGESYGTPNQKCHNFPHLMNLYKTLCKLQETYKPSEYEIQNSIRSGIFRAGES